MRLIDHPDVEIFFSDSAAPGSEPDSQDARTAVTSFLEVANREHFSVKKFEWIQQPVTMAGRKGASAFASVQRTNGMKDVVFAAHVAEDSRQSYPELTLFVARSSALAKGKPTSDAQFRDIARRVADSVKLRN